MGCFNWFTSKFQAGTSNQSGNIPAVESIPFVETGISGPFASGNLAVYLIHGADSMPLSNVITLEEALVQKKVVVKETGVVGQLRIKNLSEDVVFVQSGDIVKGGKQDRTIQHDLILPSKSDFVTINSFCVESGRWCKRGREDADHFQASSHYLSSKDLRMAAKSGHQHEVWREVANVQHKSALNAGVPLSRVQGESVSSLELTLDTDQVKESTETYINDLSGITAEKDDVVGYAFSINGKMNSIDLYSSNSLFQKMWPKLIRAAAVEAFTESNHGKDFATPTCEDVKVCMEDVGKYQARDLGVNGRAKVVIQESAKGVLFETRDTMNGGRWVHRNYATK